MIVVPRPSPLLSARTVPPCFATIDWTMARPRPVPLVVDDVEFLFDEQTKTLQFRSASRVGYSDWNVNRKRMEDIRNQMLGKM